MTGFRFWYDGPRMRAGLLLPGLWAAVLFGQPDRSKTCFPCHREIWESYQKTGMGRSFARPSSENTPIPAAAYYHAPSESYFTVFLRNGEFVQRRHQLDSAGRERNVMEKRIDYVMGSGNHARTYLHRTPSGTLRELPVGWYAENGGYWAMNPGYDRPDHDGFRRPINYDCMFCHNAYPQVPARNEKRGEDAVYLGALPEGIDCERCHGAGARHIQLAGSGGNSALAILNPARLSAERQYELCLSCHLETTSFPLPNALRRYERGPFSFRPGEALTDFLLNFDHAPSAGREDKFEIAGSAYRLAQSACFNKSGGKMRCTTCHNPHDVRRGPAAISRYEAICLNCHAAAHERKGCIECHMPKRRTEDVIHVSVTDHKIQRKPPRDLLAERTERRDEYRGEVVLYYPRELPRTAEGELYRAVAQVKEKSNLKAGIAQLTAAIAKYAPPRADWYLELADALDNDGQTAKAIPWYREAARRDPSSYAAWQRLGTALRRSAKHAEAIAALQRATALSPGPALTWHELGLAYRSLGRTAEALTALEKALQRDPELPEAHNNLGILRYSGGDAARAEASFREAIRIKPDYADAHGNLANLLSAAKRFDEAKDEFDRALRLRPNDAQTRFNYAMLLGKTRRYDAAQTELESCLRTDASFAPAHELLGDLLLARGQAPAAVAHYREAVRLRPDSLQSTLSLGIALAATGDRTEALVLLRKAAAAPDADVRQRALAVLRDLGATPR